MKKSIEYHLVSTTMTENQCQFVKSPVLCRSLKYSGLPSNTQREIVARKASQLGLKISPYMLVTQVVNHITDIMKFIKSKCIPSICLKGSIEGHKLKIKYSSTLLSKTFHSSPNSQLRHVVITLVGFLG